VIKLHPYREIVNPIPSSFNLLSLNTEYNMSNLLKQLNTDVFLTLRVENLLDEDMHTAEWVRGRINSIPTRPGRRVFLGVKMKI
jgi:outer membrane receptor protein involved in Fe transport